MDSERLMASSPNSYVRARLVGVAVVILGVAGLTVWGVSESWRRTGLLAERLTAASLDSFRLAGRVQRRVLTLNGYVLHFAINQSSATWGEFEEASPVLKQWIDDQQVRLHTDLEQKLFTELNNAYDDYVKAAHSVRSALWPAPSSTTPLRQLEHFENQGERLLLIGSQLAEAHREAEAIFLRKANRSLARLRIALIASMALVLGLALLLTWFVYRHLIAPLRFQLVQSEALLQRQEKLATLGTLAAGIAHEIRNPLTSIRARLYTLSKHIKGNPPGLLDADMIGDEITRLERIVQEVLQFARPSQPCLRVTRADAPLHEVVKLMSSTLAKSQIELVVASETNRLVSIDPALFLQVMINLVRNASEAIVQNGTVTLRTRSGQSRLNDKVQEVVFLAVVDTGQGIAPDVAQRLFDPFFSTKETGTGLGLSIAARIVEKHGGALHYQTRIGHGTTFEVILPVAAEADQLEPQ